jgi:hypothetical protein
VRRVWIWIVFGVLVFMAGAASVAVVAVRLIKPRAPMVYVPEAHPTTPWHGTVPAVVVRDEEDDDVSPKLPSIKRKVPIFEVRVLDGCSKKDLDTVESRIGAAIETGAPLYNDGDFDGCFTTYESTALAIERDVGKTCKGPASALKTGREQAAKQSTSAERAWAMRDAFDGLLDVIDRGGAEL